MLKMVKAVACAAFLVGSAGLAWAQTAQEVLQAAAEKLTQSQSLSATMTIHGEGAEMFRSMLPKGEGKLLLRRIEPKPDADPAADAETDADGNERAGEEPQPHWQARVTGKSTTGNPKEPDPVEIDFIDNGQTHRWIDPQQKKVFDMVPARAMGSRSAAYSASKMLVPNELMQVPPFKAEMDGEEMSVLDSEEVNGVKCDVLEIKYPKPEPGVRTVQAKAQEVKLFFGQDDHLLHRIERISGSDLMKMVIVLEFSQWAPSAKLEDKDFEMDVPAGYELVEAKPTTIRPTTTRSVQGAPKPAEKPAERPTEQAEHRPMAPDFSFQLASGEAVSLESLRGSTAVLYFWGTWCLECRDFNPLVSKLAGNAGDQPLRVFGLAQRERDPASAADLVRLREYKFEVAPNAADAAKAFNIVYYPTFVVIDPEGGLVGTETVRRGSTIDGTMARVQEMIAKASPEVKLPPAPNKEPPVPQDIP